jgi:hypothetical protein
MLTLARAWTVLLALAAVALASLPLLGVLGYESSFVLGLLAALSAAQVAAVRVVRARQVSRGIRSPLATVMGLWARGALAALSLLFLPLLVLSANALRVRNCAFVEGLGWFALLPAVSALTGAAAGTVAGLLLRSRVGAALLATAAVLGSLALGVVRFYQSPPVFGYDPFGGWFSGSLYDEALTISPLLLAARALHLLEAASLLLLAAALCDAERLRLRLRPPVGWRSWRCFRPAPAGWPCAPADPGWPRPAPTSPPPSAPSG